MPGLDNSRGYSPHDGVALTVRIYEGFGTDDHVMTYVDSLENRRLHPYHRSLADGDRASGASPRSQRRLMSE